MPALPPTPVSGAEARCFNSFARRPCTEYVARLNSSSLTHAKTTSGRGMQPSTHLGTVDPVTECVKV